MNPFRIRNRACARLLSLLGALSATTTTAATPPAHASPDLDQLTTVRAAADLCSGKYTSEALVAAMLARARARADLNAFITLDTDGAMAAARRADALHKPGGRCKPLAGVPVVIKDNIAVAGLPASAGTPALKGHIPKADAPVVARLRAAGAIVLGKTNMHELAFGVSGYNTAFKSSDQIGVRNAYNSTKVAGGSSSGNGAAIGARIVTAGLGTDTGGSVRVPCALNGCAALRPTIGRYAQAGIAPISHTRDTAGPMAATVADVALLDRVITGAKPAPAFNLKKLRLGLIDTMLANMDADTQAAFDAALVKMKEAGVTVVKVDMPRLNELNNAVGFPLALYEAYDDMQKFLQVSGANLTVAELAKEISSPDVKGTYDGLVIPRKLPGPNNTLVDAKPIYDSAMKDSRPAMQALYRNTFKLHRLDALVFPTVPRVAIDATPESSSLPNFGLTIQNTDPGSNVGVPGLQIALALGASSRLPVGLELDGPSGSDARLLAIGIALEGLFGRLTAPAAKQ